MVDAVKLRRGKAFVGREVIGELAGVEFLPQPVELLKGSRTLLVLGGSLCILIPSFVGVTSPGRRRVSAVNAEPGDLHWPHHSPKWFNHRLNRR